MSEHHGCCRFCCNLVLTLGLAALFLWLSLRPSKPKCSIQYFYLPALNQSSNSQSNTNLYLDLQLDNGNKDKAIYYDALNLTIYYAPNMSHSTGNVTLPGFHQGHKKKATKNATVETYDLDWQAVFRSVSANGSAVFRVNLVTEVRYKILFWKTKRHGIKVAADVVVNDQGRKVNKKGIKLKSGAAELGGGWNSVRVGVLLSLFMLILLNSC